jgi:transposase
MVTKRLDETVRRRLKAGRMMLSGKTPAEAAHAVGVARQTAYTWKALLDEGGIDALRAMPTPGRPARLDGEQLQALARTLLDKPTEHGFGTELWTLKHQARPQAATGALQVAHLGSRHRDAWAQAIHHGHRHPGLLL